MKDRITKTAKLGYDIGTSNAHEPDGEMIVTCVKTRLAHAGVRHLLPKSPYWSKVADEEIPISQRDMMVTWHSLPTTVMRNLVEWKVPIPAAESEGFLHSWQVAAHMLGIEDEYIPKSWDEAGAQADQVLTPVLGPTPEGGKLADILLNLGSASRARSPADSGPGTAAPRAPPSAVCLPGVVRRQGGL
ncbi:oxygenase MpaB family protein [Actinomadura xylanilytica]|uniref:oxygenase MpaB family protein n=1 Tax=Actinomadura xylanilytica TaxID=887459 RepID=UPI00255AEAB7|nr:oxygenase MpaB family protein [Actinomadura xylanilytica]MDL4775286.1 oxygenase MpaB family protein [Actinomadura xylanilytica]